MTQIVNKINNAKIARLKEVIFQKNKKSQILIHFIYTEGYLASYALKKNKIIAKFSLTEKGYSFRKIKLIKKNAPYLKKNSIFYKINYGISSLIVNTTKGIFPTYVIKKLQLGGKLIFAVI